MKNHIIQGDYHINLKNMDIVTAIATVEEFYEFLVEEIMDYYEEESWPNFDEEEE